MKVEHTFLSGTNSRNIKDVDYVVFVIFLHSPLSTKSIFSGKLRARDAGTHTRFRVIWWGKGRYGNMKTVWTLTGRDMAGDDLFCELSPHIDILVYIIEGPAPTSNKTNKKAIILENGTGIRICPTLLFAKTNVLVSKNSGCSILPTSFFTECWQYLPSLASYFLPWPLCYLVCMDIGAVWTILTMDLGVTLTRRLRIQEVLFPFFGKPVSNREANPIWLAKFPQPSLLYNHQESRKRLKKYVITQFRVIQLAG